MRFIVSLVLLFSLGALMAADITAYHRKQFGAVTYNKYGIAHIVTAKGWLAINKKKKVLYTPFIYDNGPDYVQDGLLRYVAGGKMGFVTEAGKVKIKAEFDFVFPFEAGIARYCNGCRAVSDGEHSTLDEKTGTWGKIDKQGKKQP